MAEIRISGQDLRKIEQVQRQLGAAIQKVDARTLERIGTDVAGRINAGVSKLLADIEKVQESLGVTDPASQRALRTGLETVQGASGAVQQIAPFAALLTNSPQLRIALLAGAAVVGGLEGASRDETRRAIAKGRQIEADIAYEALRKVDAALHEARVKEQSAKNAARPR